MCWICLTDDVAFGVAEVRGTRTAPLLNMTGMEEEVLWYGAAYLFVPVQSCLCLTELWQTNATSMKCYSRLFCLLFNNTKCCRMTTQDLIGQGQYSSSCSRTMWIISIGLLDPLTSPIEHVWDILGQRVRQRVPRPRTLQALGAALQEEWRRIPQLQIARLIRSMRRRCVACIDATGGHTRYWQICEVLWVTLVTFHTNFLIHF